jgi:hypothetical protein
MAPSRSRGASLGQLQARASVDLKCPAQWLRLQHLDARAKLVEGCGDREVYIESCELIRGAEQCTWRVDSRALAAPPTPGLHPSSPHAAPPAAASPAAARRQAAPGATMRAPAVSSGAPAEGLLDTRE